MQVAHILVPCQPCSPTSTETCRELPASLPCPPLAWRESCLYTSNLRNHPALSSCTRSSDRQGQLGSLVRNTVFTFSTDIFFVCLEALYLLQSAPSFLGYSRSDC